MRKGNGRSRANSNADYDVVVVGGANIDYLVQGETLPKPGETIDGSAFLKAGGGKGANQAVAAARLGARVAFVGCVGADETGNELICLLKAERIDTRLVRHDKKAATGVALVMIDCEAEKQIMVAPGANHQLSVQDIHRAASVIERAKVLLMQFEVPMRTVVEASKIATKSRVPIVLDPAPAQKAPRELIRRVTVIRPNSAEAKALTGVEVCDVGSARRAARKLLKAGAKVVVTQAGDAGDLLVWDSGEDCFGRLPVKAVDATGAGDAFAAALAVAVAEGRSWQQAGAFANAAAALATTKFGAQPSMPCRADVLRLMRQSGHLREARVF